MYELPQGDVAPPSQPALPDSYRCHRCGHERPINQFTRAGFVATPQGGRMHGVVCRKCRNRSTKRRIELNSLRAAGDTRSTALIRYHKGHDRVLNYLTTHPCVECGEDDICVLQFDHVRGRKEFNIAQAGGRSAARIAREIAKCEVVCANCHMRRTHQRTNSLRWQLSQIAKLMA